MSNTNLSNDYIDYTVLTFHTYARCVSWIGDRHTRYLGRVSYYILILTNANAKLYEEYTDKGIIKCF